MRDYLIDIGIRHIIVACPNCHRIFSDYGEGLAVRTVYEILADAIPDVRERLDATVTIHDPCALRFAPEVHDAVRRLVAAQGLALEEMDHCRETTLCCGSGGAVDCVAPELAESWTRARQEEARERRIITYCAGCAGVLDAVTPTCHVADLVMDPRGALSGRAKMSRPPITYWNRLMLKRRFRKTLPAPVTRERPSEI